MLGSRRTARAGPCRLAPPLASLGPRAGAPRSPPQSPWANRGGRRHTVRRTACSSRAPLLPGPNVLREGRAPHSWPPGSSLQAMLHALDAFLGDFHALDALEAEEQF